MLTLTWEPNYKMNTNPNTNSNPNLGTIIVGTGRLVDGLALICLVYVKMVM